MIEEDRGLQELREGIREVRDRFPNEYRRDLDAKSEYPEGFGQDMTESGYLGAFIPEEHGGTELDPTAACTNLRFSHGDEHVLGMPRSF